MTEEEVIEKLMSIKTPPEESKFIHDINTYNSGRNSDLAFALEAMQPDVDFTPVEGFSTWDRQQYLVMELKIDERTEPLFERILREGEDHWIRNKIIFRFRAAVMGKGFEPSQSLLDLLGQFAEDPGHDLWWAASETLKDMEKALSKKRSKVFRNPFAKTNPTATPTVAFPSESPKPETNEAEKPEAATPSAASSDETDNPLSTWWLWLIAVGCVVGICGWAIRRK
jgi:hypothetical protein